MPTEPLAIFVRRQVLVNTDPLRRHYNGAHFSSELQWTAWAMLERMRHLKPGADPQARLEFWRELNNFAVSQRGEIARCEFKVDKEPCHAEG